MAKIVLVCDSSGNKQKASRPRIGKDKAIRKGKSEVYGRGIEWKFK